MAEKTLVVIDGKSVFYRGYYAMGNLSKGDGTPTSGVYGFATIAMEIVKKLAPTKVIVAWDKAHTSTEKRTAIFPEYKAGRVKPPEDFYAQIPLLVDLVKALGWNFYECDGYEADDIIGTLALQADEDLNEAGECRWVTYIVSSDLDMLQIVDENTRMYRLLRGFSELEELDVPAVEAKYGIEKSQFLDLKALKGDASDNIPGVPGVGEKTAVKLLAEFGTLDAIYENIAEIGGAVRTKLEAGKESAFMSRKLAKIMTDAPVSLAEAEDLVIDADRIEAALRFLEFFSLIRKFKKELSLGAETDSFAGHRSGPRRFARRLERDGTFSASAEKDRSVKRTVSAPQNSIKNQTEDATRTEGADAVGIEDVNAAEVEIPDGLIIEEDVKAKMHRDKKFAERVLAGEKYWDVAQAEFLLNPLKRTEKTDQADLFGDMKSEEDLRADYRRQWAEYQKYPKLYAILTEYDLPLIPVLFEMEREGILLDLKYFEKLRVEFAEEVKQIEKRIYSMTNETFNVNSPVQLAGVLFDKLGLPTAGIKKTTRGYSTGAKELEKLQDAHPVIPVITEYREAAKLLSTYIIPLPEQADVHGRIHTTFTQNVTATGRLSSVNPNLQNIPVRSETGKRIRQGMIAGPGKKFVAADYAQFELRLAAVLAGDEALIESFNSGVDIHTKTAAEVFEVPMSEVTKDQRRAAKVINFGVMYGMSTRGLAEAAKMSFSEAKEFIEQYFEVRKPIKNYLERVLTQARNEGFVETFYGRRRPTPDVNSTNRIVRAAAERAAQNMPIQGTEADLMKRAMVRVRAALPSGAKLVLQIHDSLVVECDEKLEGEVREILQREMEGVAPELAVKLAVDVKAGDNLGEV